jgi:hypothetical protein
MLALTSKWKIVEYGDGDFVIYENMGLFGYTKSHATSSFDAACAWCDKQVADSKVKSVTYVIVD